MRVRTVSVLAILASGVFAEGQSADRAMENVGVTMGVAAGFDVMREFLPDLLHRK